MAPRIQGGGPVSRQITRIAVGEDQSPPGSNPSWSIDRKRINQRSVQDSRRLPDALACRKCGGPLTVRGGTDDEIQITGELNVATGICRGTSGVCADCNRKADAEFAAAVARTFKDVSFVRHLKTLIAAWEKRG